MTIDETCCPLCQQNNFCGVNGSEPCWCTTANIDKKLLASVPKHLAKKSCVCAQCIEKFNAADIVNQS